MGTHIVIALCLLALTGCGTIGLPQSQLNPLIKKNLGRELVVRLDGKVLNPLQKPEPLTYGANAEVDIRVEVLGSRMYGKGPLWAQVAALPLPVMGIADLQCAEKREWETDTICTCRIRLWQDIETVLNHEIEHCKGYGEL